MRFPPRPLACLAAVLLAACGAQDEKPSAPSTPSASPASAPEEPSMTVTHILIGLKDAGTQSTRTPDEALALAKSLIADLNAGRTMEDLMKFTDDKGSDGKAHSSAGQPPGTYVIGGGAGMKPVPEFLKACKETPVGKITPEPVKTQFGYHIIRRDK